MPNQDDLFIFTNATPESDPSSPENADTFRAPDDLDATKEIAPTFMNAADALFDIPAVPSDDDTALDDTVAVEGTVSLEGDVADSDDVPKRHPLMRILGGIVPHIGDQPFDVFRKCLMLVGILVFIGAATYLVDDLILIPIQNNILTQTLQGQYDPDVEQTLSQDEQNFKYPKNIDPAFKKLYYQNEDVRGWINYCTTDDGATFTIDYPIVQSEDNDYYLFHDFNGIYNKNGTLFFDYRNSFESKKDSNRNTIIYGHNMASGQMFAGLNKLVLNLDRARLAPTFTMNTIYNQAQYKVFAVMLLNNASSEGVPFGYLRTDFKNDVEFATFLSEIAARSMYKYGDVDIRPTDEIVMLSTCTDYESAQFPDARTVVVARKVRKNEKAKTDVSKIEYNKDVLMPYAWYVNQKMEPHPYYTNPDYKLPELESLSDYLIDPSNPSQVTTTTTTTKASSTEVETTKKPENTTERTTVTQPIIPPETEETTSAPRITSIAVESTPSAYYVGSAFDFENTKVVGIYSDGYREDIPSDLCAITGFDSSIPGECTVNVHYGSLSVSYTVMIVNHPDFEQDFTTTSTTAATTAVVTTTAPTTTTVRTTVTTTTTVRTTVATTTTVTTTQTTTTQATTTTVAETTTTEVTTTTESMVETTTTESAAETTTTESAAETTTTRYISFN